MKKILFGLFAILSVCASAKEINLWEEANIDTQMGYTGFELGGKYYNKSLDNVQEVQKYLDEIYSVKNTVNDSLKNRAMLDTYEKDWILNADINYLKSEDLETPIYNLNYGVLNDITRYGINIAMFKGDSKIGEKEYNSKGGQVNLYFNRNEDLGNLFGTLYIGKNNQEFKENSNEIDNFYYGYFTSLEQKYESFNLDEFYSGYFINFDISRTETDYKLTSNGKEIKTSKDNDSVNGEIGFSLEKNLFFFNDVTTQIKLLSSIGKEFLEEDKYKDLGKDEYEVYAKEKLEISTSIGSGVDLFTGAEYRKSLKSSSAEKNIYLGFKINF